MSAAQPAPRPESLMTSRRAFVAACSVGALAPGVWVSGAETVPTKGPFRCCLNTSTIRGQKLGIVQEIELIAAAGYDGIEPWIDQLVTYEREGGSLKDLGQRLADHGLTVESAIGFADYLHPDEKRRAEALDNARRDMERVRTIGGTRIAAPPAGVTDMPELNLRDLAPRFGALVRAGRELGVMPQLELWGFSQLLHRLGEVAYLMADCGEGDALALLDVYHIYKGGSSFAGLGLFSGTRMENFHINDYPAEPDRAAIGDQHRVYPGDGVAPLSEILQTLYQSGYRGSLSLELFNPAYYAQDAKLVLETGLRKTRAAIVAAGYEV